MNGEPERRSDTHHHPKPRQRYPSPLSPHTDPHTMLPDPFCLFPKHQPPSAHTLLLHAVLWCLRALSVPPQNGCLGPFLFFASLY